VIAFDPARKVSQYLGVFTGIFRGLTGFSVSQGIGLAVDSLANPVKEAAETELRPSVQLKAPWSHLSGGFISQEIVSEYNWVLANPEALPVFDSAEWTQETLRI